MCIAISVAPAFCLLEAIGSNLFVFPIILLKPVSIVTIIVDQLTVIFDI